MDHADRQPSPSPPKFISPATALPFPAGRAESESDAPPRGSAAQITPAELQQRVDSLRDQLTRAQQQAALGELLSTTTHEFNNILTTIINYARLGLRHGDPATREKAFNKILNAGQRASKITHSVLGMARNRQAGLEAVDLRALIEETLILLEREMNKYRVRVETDFPEVPRVWACGNQIQQVLLNLMINARQAMPNGGRLILKLSKDKSQPTVDLMVRDFGQGIPEDRLPKIFDAYYSTKTGPDATGCGGSGLGLAACREIIEQHRGRIRVESTPGKGTAFTIKLPIARDRVAPTVPFPATHVAPTPSEA